MPTMNPQASYVSKVVRIQDGSSDKTTTGLETKRPQLPQSHDYLNIISVVGKARTGKSWLLNYLAQSPSLFEVHNDDVCTSGIELSSPMSFPGLKEEVVYMNVEGSSEASDERALRMHTVAMLFSKVYIYQIRGTVLLKDFLKEISSLTKKVQLSQNPGGTKTRPFGHLVIVCRDYTSQKVREPDILSKLTELEPTDNVYNDKTMHAILRRNSGRTQLSNFFASISVVCLPPPCKNNEDLRTSSLKFEKVSDEFKQSVVQLQSIIRGKFEDKSHNVFGEPLRFSNFFTLLETMVQTLNRGDIIVPTEILEKMRSIILQKAANRAKEHFDREIEKISVKVLPNIEDTINVLLHSTKDIFMSEMPTDMPKPLTYVGAIVDEKPKVDIQCSGLKTDFENGSHQKTPQELPKTILADGILVSKIEEASNIPQSYLQNFCNGKRMNIDLTFVPSIISVILEPILMIFSTVLRHSPVIIETILTILKITWDALRHLSVIFETNLTISSTVQYRNDTRPLRKDGNPDMRFAANKLAYCSSSTPSTSPASNYSSAPGPLRKDGNPDMRFTANKIAYGSSSTSASNYSSGASHSCSSAPGPLTKAGKPDMRFKANKMAYG